MGNELGDKLLQLRKELSLSQKDVAQRLRGFGVDVTNQAVSKWEKGATQPNAEQFLALCRALEVSDISARFIGESRGVMHGLNESGKRRVREYADILRESGMFSETPREKAKGRILQLYDMAVSAGTGQFLDSSDYEDVSVGDEVPHSAKFGVRVAGDSMQPMYYDGDIVWVSPCETLENGQVGVVLYDDNAYLKQLVLKEDGAYLRSLNPKYEDIRVRSFAGMKVFGRAVK